MNLVPAEIESIVVGQPLPCALFSESGVLLANKGFMVHSQFELEVAVGRRSQIFIDADQSDNFRRAYVNRLNNLMLSDQALGQLAEVQISPYDGKKGSAAEFDDNPDWFELQAQAHGILRSVDKENFLPRLAKLHNELKRQTQRNPDGTLFALIYLSSSEVRRYSATHAMLVCVMCSLAARDVLKWSDDSVEAMGQAALTMNIGMSDLQDRLALQQEKPSTEQLRRIDKHAPKSVEQLQKMGVDDPLWLEIVLHHHDKTPGTLAPRSAGQRMARLIQRADMFSARISPRASRVPEPPSAAMQACYFDENKQIDEAGAALIKAVGIYSPGTFVRLASNEIAAVIRRGINTTMPKVAVLINRHGMVTGEPILRETSAAEFRISASVPAREIKVNHSLERLLAVTRQAAIDRLW